MHTIRLYLYIVIHVMIIGSSVVLYASAVLIVGVCMKCRILIRKLNFLQRLLSDDAGGVAVSALHALMDDPDSNCIVRECREQEATYDLKCTDEWSWLCGEARLQESDSSG